jgi:hypothetical protein
LGHFAKSPRKMDSNKSNTTTMTIHITVNDPLPIDWEIDMNHPELITLSPFAFFPICGGRNSVLALVHGEYFLGINGSNSNQFVVRTDRINQPDYGAIWLISDDRLTLTYSHTEDDL